MVGTAVETIVLVIEAVKITMSATLRAHQRYSRLMRFVVCLGPPQLRRCPRRLTGA